MRYSDSLVREVIDSCDIVELISEHVRLKRAGSSYVGLCPFHNEKTPSFNVNPARQFYYCFGCHAGGNAVTFLMSYQNCTFVEALKILADRAGIALPEEDLDERAREQARKRDEQLAIYKEAAKFYFGKLRSPRGRNGYRYLRERGLKDETIVRFGLGYADSYGNSLYLKLKEAGYRDGALMESGLFKFDEKSGPSDRFWNRVMFPIMDERGRVIGFGGRVMGDGKPKYLNSPETALFNKRRHLYALNYARSTREKEILLGEGYMDVITLHEAGFTNAVASLGTALTEEQCTLLRRFTSSVVLLYDSDGAGKNAALRAIPLLRQAGIVPRVASLTPHKDPDEFIRKEGAEALRERIRAAEDAVLYELDQTAEGHSRDDPASWTAFQKAAASRLSRIGEELERENYLKAACRRFGLPEDGMRRLVARTAAYGTPAESYRPPRSGTEYPRGSEKAREEDTGIGRARKLMLCILAGWPEAYGQVRGLFGPASFGAYRPVAEALYAQLSEEAVSISALIGQFPDPEEQRMAASVFGAGVPAESEAELDRLFKDAVLGIMRADCDAELAASAEDVSALQRYIEKKRLLERMEREGNFHLTFRRPAEG